ncbi:MAG: TonB-dependent receptor [Cyclobacteriaceae bacterium]
MQRFSLLWIFISGIQLCFGQSDKERYEAWLDSIKNEKYIGIEMELDEIIITDSLQRGLINDPKTQFNMRSTDQLMHNLSGVNMVRRGNFANEPMLRGLTSERYVLSIDGMRIQGACTDKMDPASSYIEPINLKSLDVTFGTQNNMMGSSTGGSVDFGLKKPVYNLETPFRASISTNYSTVSNGFDQTLDLNYSKDKFAVRISGVHRKAENYTDGAGEEVRYSQFEKWNYASSLSYRINDRDMLSFDFVGDDATDVGYPALPMDVSSAQAKLFGLSYISDDFWILKEPEIKIYHNFIDHQMDDTKRDSVAMHMDMPGNSNTTGAFVRGFLISNIRSNLEFKADYHKSFWHAEMTMFPNETDQLPMFMLTWPDIHRSISGVELKYSSDLTPKQKVITSGRVEQVTSHISSDFGERQLSVFGKTGSENRNEILTNLSAQYRWTPGKSSAVSLKASYGERVPSASEQYGFYLFNQQDGYDYLGDPDLKKERNVHVEAGHELNRSGFKVETAIFGYFFKDYIMGIYDSSLSAMTIGALGVKWHENTSNATMLGGEFSLSNQLLPSLSGKMDVKYVYGEDFEGAPLPQMPPLKLSYSITQVIKGWNIQPEIEWSQAQDRVSEKFNERTTDDFTLINLRISKQFTAKNTWSIGGGIENLTDVAYREHFDIGQILRPGRNGYLQMKVQF